MEEEKVCRDFYANLVEVNTSVYDVTLQFKLRSFSKDPEDIFSAIDVCNVRMSPQHAKALVAILLKHITNYEIDFKCELPLSPDLQKMIDDIKKEENDVEHNE